MSASKMEPALMTIAQVAQRLNVSTKSVRRLITRSKLPRCKHLGKILIPTKAVEIFIQDSMVF